MQLCRKNEQWNSVEIDYSIIFEAICDTADLAVSFEDLVKEAVLVVLVFVSILIQHVTLVSVVSSIAVIFAPSHILSI